MKVRNLSIQQRDFILGLPDIVTPILFLISGIGSYRIFIVFAIDRVSSHFKIPREIAMVGSLAYLISAYFDYMRGPIIVPDTQDYFIVVLPAFIIVRLIIMKSFKRLISDITQNQYFETCPSCHYYNTHLVGSCSNCDYKKGKGLSGSTAKLSNNLKGDNAPPELLSVLVLGEDEEILFYKKLSSITGKIKNGKDISRNQLFLTTKSIILLNVKKSLLRRPEGWSERDVIPLSDVISIYGKMKSRFASDRPSLAITSTNNDVYEIVFPGFKDYVLAIDDVVAMAKSVNPQVDAANMLTHNAWHPNYRLTLNPILFNDSTDAEYNKRMMILLPLVLVLLGLVLWQVFHSGL